MSNEIYYNLGNDIVAKIIDTTGVAQGDIIELLSTALRACLWGRLLDTDGKKRKCLDISHLDKGLAYHEKYNKKYDLECIVALFNILSDYCEKYPELSTYFYCRTNNNDYHFNTHRYVRSKGRNTIIPSPVTLLHPIYEKYGYAFYKNNILLNFRNHYFSDLSYSECILKILNLCDIYNRNYDVFGKRVQYQHLNESLISESGYNSNIIDAFIEILVWGKLVKLDPYVMSNLYKIAKVDKYYLRNTFWGLHTNDWGLNYLFEGAVLLNEKMPCCISIFGDKGTGKTSLAVTIANAIASTKGTVLYTSTEQSHESIKSLVLDWSNTNAMSYNVANNVSEMEKLENASRTGKGLFCFYQPGFGIKFEDIQKTWVSFIKDRKYKSHELTRIIVIDSLTSISNENDEWRSKLVDFVDLCKEYNCSVIFISEENKDLSSNIIPNRFVNYDAESFVSDTVMHLSYANNYESNSELASYKVRTLEIIKSRQQHCCRGSHIFRIRSGKGPRIYPSSGAILATVRKPKRYLKTKDVKYLDINEIFMSGFINTFEGKEKWLRSDTCTAIIGNGGTFKSEFVRAFSKSILYGSNGANRGIATIRMLFGQRYYQEDNEYATQIKNKYVEHCRCFEVFSQKPSDKGNWSREIILEVPSGYQYSSHLISDVAQTVAYIRINKCDLKIAIIDDVASLKVEHPFIEKDKFFLPIIVQYFESCGASVFLVCHQPINDRENTYREIHSMSHNIFSFQSLGESSNQKAKFRILKSFTAKHYRDDLFIEMSNNKLNIDKKHK